MRVILTIEAEVGLDHTDEKTEERNEALRHLGESAVRAMTTSYSEPKVASIGVVTSTVAGVAQAAAPVVLVNVEAPHESELHE